MARVTTALKMLALGALIIPWDAVAGTPEHFAVADFMQSQATTPLIDNSAFTPASDAPSALEPFSGTVKVAEAGMSTTPETFKTGQVLGRDPAVFPGVELQFFTVNGDLVPVTQDVIRFGSQGSGKSFWDMIVQPGRVWSEHADGGWSRAAFPFALVNSLEGETHNGLATFLYRRGKVSRLRFQIVQQTGPYYISDYFTAAGSAPMTLRGTRIVGRAALEQRYRAALADRVRFDTWEHLADIVGAQSLANFDGRLLPAHAVAAGLDFRGTFYLAYCNSAAGPLPWCDRVRFGVWSATKALANETALLRLAQKFGPEVFDLKVQDYVDGAAAYSGWANVRFRDAINMATGVGNGSTVREPNNIEDGYLDPSYSRWYEARSSQEKVKALLETGRVYPWGPGQVARYRDQDMFVLGVAMDGFLKSREGAAASIWSMLEKEVYEPIGIHYAPTNRTIEVEGPGQALMAFGYYPTIGDIVKIARLYHNEGRANGAQILYSPAIKALSAGDESRGLSTGESNEFGETMYFNAFWEVRYTSAEGCRWFVPVMEGWGGNLVALMPNGLTAVRIAKVPESAEPAESDPTPMVSVGNRVSAFCR